MAASLALCAAPSLASAQSEEPGWMDRVTPSGDLRLRYEGIQRGDREDKHQGRFRGRLGASADLTDDIGLVFGLTTGGQNPVSGNQSFGEGFALDDIGIDLLYADWDVTEDLVLIAGKMPKPWFRAGGSSLIWDSDFNPGGVGASYDAGRFFASGGSFLIAEHQDKPSTMLHSAQGGMNFSISESSSITAAVAYYGYTNTIGNQPFYRGRAKGNSVDVDGNYIYDYRSIEVSGQYRTRIGELPLLVHGQWVDNTAVSVEDTAYAFGVTIGRAREPRSFQLSWSYHDTGADAVIGTFSDSDFAGGNTDSSGHYVRARYKLKEHIAFGGTLIVSDFDEFAGAKVNYERLMLDIVFDF